MRITKILTLLLCLALALGITLFTASCDKGGNDTGNDTECTHKDATGDKICDDCGETLPDTVTLNVTVLDEDGKGVKGVEVCIKSGATYLTLGATDENGVLKYVVQLGTYTVELNNLPEYWYVVNNNQEFAINHGASSLTFTAINNAPDGSAEKPFYAGDAVESIVMPAGASYNYYATGTSRYLVINNSGVKVTYNDTVYTPDDNGIVKLLLNGPESVYDRIYFTITNILTTENTVSGSYEFLPGTYENPYTAELGTAIDATIAKEASVYYKWVATESGKLIVSSSDENNYITLINDYVVTEGSNGAASVAMGVAKGDSVLILVASKDSTSETDTITFTLSFEEAGLPDYDTITVSEALDLCGPEPSEERYYLRVFVKEIKNISFGEMTVYDSTGEIYVYGTYSFDGELTFPQIEDRPKPGDEIIIHCVLQDFNGTKEVKNARLIAVNHIEQEFDINDYTESTVADARESADGTKVIVEGVVAGITYANGQVPSGVILVDSTGSIYVYDAYLAQSATVGNTVKIAGSKAHWILDSEQSSAEKFGYKGACQITEITILSNDNGNTAFDTSWIEEATVADIMNTPVTEDITTLLFKVTALVKKVPGSGFINYYINDIDGVTGSYVYTQCNGSDFAWLDAFDGKICTVYLTALNAKSTSTGCVWRFVPIKVVDENYVFDTNNAPEYAVKYHGIPQFLPEYSGDPALEVVTTVSSELLGFEGATLSYVSSDDSIIKFTTEDGKTVMNCLKSGAATVTVTGSYLDKETYSYTLTITVTVNEEVEYVSVADAIAASVDDIVTVRGIVGPSVVNKVGFYLIDDTGIIAVIMDEATIATLQPGYDVIITAKRDRFYDSSKNGGVHYGQTALTDAKVTANYYGTYDYNTSNFITGKTLADLYATSGNEDHTTEVYIVEGVVEVVESAYYTNIQIKSADGNTTLELYCSSASQYNWLKEFAGETVTMEIALCNWNNKKFYKGCVLAVYTDDGKVINRLNFS